MVAFPRLFSLALVQDGRVDEFYDTNPERGRWMFGWRRDLFEWEKDLLTSLLTRLDGVAMGVGMDSWVWKPDKDGLFSVKSCFSLLQNQCLSNGVLNRDEEAVFRENWRGKALGKVLAFSWTLLLDRIPTGSWGRKILSGVFFAMAMTNRWFIFSSIVMLLLKFGGR